MNSDATAEEIQRVCDVVADMGLSAQALPGEQRTAIGIMGNDGPVDSSRLRGLPGVRQAIPVSAPFKVVSREWHPEDTVVTLDNGLRIGGKELVIMGGPCAVESEQQLMASARIVTEAGGVVLRGGAFKPRTSPYSFQGLGREGLELLAAARERYGLAIVTEAIDVYSLEEVVEFADIVQLGARNMQNFALLREVGRAGKPVMLKRGLAATIKEWLLAAEYVMSEGNERVILCERGIRSFDGATRNVMDVAAVAMAKELTHLPIISDPSHATGRRSLILPTSRASVAAGADGLIIETHPDPNAALSDGPQTLFPEQFKELVGSVRAIGATLERPLAVIPPRA